MSGEGMVHPHCRNAPNPYHACSAYCFRIIVAEAKARDRRVSEASAKGGHSKLHCHEAAASRDEIDADDDKKPPVEENVEGDITKLTGRNKKLFELRPKMNEARKANQTAMAHPDCRNTSNPYHECSAYCFRIIAGAKARDRTDSEVSEASAEGGHSKLPYHEVAASRNMIDYAEEPADDDNKPPVQENVKGDITKLTGRKKKLLELRPKMNEARRANQTAMAHLDCRNTSNPYHECSAYCFRIIAEAKARDRRDLEVADANAEGSRSKLPHHEVAASRDEIYDAEEPANDDNKPPVEENVGGDIAKLTGRKKKLFDLRPKMNEVRKANQTAMAHLDCRNSSNPYHECSAYCFRIIAEAKARDRRDSEVSEASAEGSHSKVPYHEVAASHDEIDADDDNKPPVEENVEGDITKLTGRKRKLFELRPKMNEARKANQTAMAHPDCRNASNPYHECSAYCFRVITEAKAHDRRDLEVSEASADGGHSKLPYHEAAASRDEIDDAEEPADNDNKLPVQENVEGDITKLTGRKKKLFELRPKMNEVRKANQTAMVAENKKLEAPTESRGITKQKWLDDRKKKIGKLLDANGLDVSKAYMLDTQEMAATKYLKWEKDPASYGGVVFNQKILSIAYKKRTKNIDIDLDKYNKMKEADPKFYCEASSLQYGKAPKVSEDKIYKMVQQLKDWDEKRKSFSSWRRFCDEKGIDSINDRNEHFNKKIEPAFGKYTLEIKNNLERGTALPD